MSQEHIKIFSGDMITGRRFKNILEDNQIHVILKEDRIPGYEITNNMCDLLVLNDDKEKAEAILNEHKI